jgi:hypothetical protein
MIAKDPLQWDQLGQLKGVCLSATTTFWPKDTMLIPLLVLFIIFTTFLKRDFASEDRTELMEREVLAKVMVLL